MQRSPSQSLFCRRDIMLLPPRHCRCSLAIRAHCRQHSARCCSVVCTCGHSSHHRHTHPSHPSADALRTSSPGSISRPASLSLACGAATPPHREYPVLTTWGMEHPLSFARLCSGCSAMHPDPAQHCLRLRGSEAAPPK